MVTRKLALAVCAAAFVAAFTVGLDAMVNPHKTTYLTFSQPVQLPGVALGAGFAVLTLALFSGFIFVRDLFAQHLIHKTVLSCLAWIVFAILLFGRWRFGWRGRVARTWTLSGFALLGLAYFGSKIVLETILGRHWG